MVFIHPGALWLLLLVLPLSAAHLRHHTGLAPARVAIVAFLRAAALVLLVLALSRPVVERHDESRTTVAVVDVSESISDSDLKSVETALADLMPGDEREPVRLVVFDRTARQVQGQDKMLPSAGLRSLRTATVEAGQPGGARTAPGSVIADTLDLASALIPYDGRGRVLLYTDGLATGNDARTAAYRLAERGVGTWVTPLGQERAGDVVLRSVSLPASAAVGATIRLKADIESSQPSPVEVLVRCDGEAADEARVPVDLSGGLQEVFWPCPLRRQGVLRCTVEVVAQGDPRLDNNTLRAAVRVEAPTEVRVVEDDPAAPATTALVSLLGPAANVRALTLDGLSDLTALDAADVLVLADVPAAVLPAELQQAIVSRATEGMGLLVTGGRRAFGPGGYADTPLAEALPVRSSQRVERRDPSTTLVIIIDTSGSMGGPRVNLAKEIARLALARLKPHDKAGIVEFYGSKRWAAPIQPASNAIDLQRALNRLSAGGGTIILPAIEEAYYALRNVRTRTRHVLVLTDGGVEPGAFEPLIRRMADEGITLSTVMVGPGEHSAFLASLAQWGRGRFYAAPDPFNLPEIIVKQPESAWLSPFVEQSTPLVRKSEDPIVGEIDFSAAPRLEGYVETEARPTADVLIESGLGHPVLARWRYGLGGVVAYTSQIAGDWTSDLARWPDYARLWGNLVRSLRPLRADRALRITPELRAGGLEVWIENQGDTRTSTAAPVDLTMVDESGGSQRWVLDPIQPDRWNIRIRDVRPGTYRLEAGTADGRLSGSAAVEVPPVREVPAAGPDRDLLDDIAAMQALAAQKAVELAARTSKRPYELWCPLITIALGVFLANVLVRRWPTSGRIGPRAAWTVVGIGLLMAAATPPTVSAREPATAPTTLPVPPPREALAELEAAWDAADAASSEAHLAQACRLVLMRDGHLDGLVDYLRPLPRGDVRRAVAAAQVARWSGDLERAHQELVGATSAGLANPQVWAELARVEEMMGNDPAAIRALDQALAGPIGPGQRFALRVRRALASWGVKDPPGARDALRAAAAERPDAVGSSFCAHLAAVGGDDELALELRGLFEPVTSRFHEHSFRGLFLLRLDRPAEALVEFEAACQAATLSRDRAYAFERIVACAREAGQLGDLADRWLAEQDLSVERLNALVAVLRELGRSEDALALLRRPPTGDAHHRLIESPEFQQQVIAVAAEAGKLAEAEAAYRALLDREPGQVEWRVAMARLMLLDGRREEAAELFGGPIESADDPAGLMALAEGARRLALDEPALAAARKASELDGRCRIRAGLFEADLARERGDTDRAVRLLQAVRDEAQQTPTLLMSVAETFERYGQKAEALELFRRLYQQTGGEDVLLRFAWLLEENERFDEAYGLWKQMWQTTQVEARLRQAQERLLDLAARTGKLADLAIELEESLDAGAAGQRELSLLVDLYAHANDPVSASEILAEFGRRSGDEVEMLKRLARVYLSCEQFGRCNAVLRRLVQLDAEGAVEHLQQLAMVALERQRPEDARSAVAELVARGGDTVAEEFAAGVLDRVGLHEEAARSYSRLLARQPDRVEAWLLWGKAMKAAGHADRAVARLQELLEEAADDDLFAVAVDGLLNLEVSPAALRYALRRVCARIAADPEKLLFYRLAADVLEAIGGTAEMNRVLEQAVVVAGEQRAALLRELMDGARADGQRDRMVRYGQSLLALGAEAPPQVYLDLGEAMLKEGQIAAAERVFERARVSADFAAIQQRVATCYEGANLPDQADRIIRELLVADPDNVALLIRSGGLREQIGDFPSAFEQYRRAADLMLRRLPASAAGDPSGQADGRTPGQRRRTQRAANLTELAQFFESAGDGLLNAARTDALQDRLAEELPRRVEEELAALATDGLTAPSLARNPRLNELVSFVRRAAFSLHRPGIADQTDLRLIEVFPQDRQLRTSAVRARLDWGLYQSAKALWGLADWPEAPIELAVETMVTDPQRLAQQLDRGDLDPELGCRLVPVLILNGRQAEARRAIRSVRTPGADKISQVARTMMAASIACDDSEALVQWSRTWVTGLAKSTRRSSLLEDLERCVRFAWNHLSADDRRALLSQLADIASQLGSDDRVRLDLLRVRLGSADGLPAEDLSHLLQAAGSVSGLSATELARVLEAAVPSDRPALLGRTVSIRKPAAQRELLCQLAGALSAPTDEALVGTFEALFRAAPRERFEPDRVYSGLREGEWVENRNQTELARRIGEALLSESPNNSAVLCVVAQTRFHAARCDEAASLAAEAIDALLAVKTPGFPERRMASDLARSLRQSDRERLVTELVEREDVEGVTPMTAMVRGFLLEASNRRVEAAAAFRAAWDAAPGNSVIGRKLATLLDSLDRPVELSRWLSAHLTRSTIMESFEWRLLTEAYVELHDLDSAARSAAKDEGPLAPIQTMRILRMRGRTDDVRMVLRRHLVANRIQGRFFESFWPKSPSSLGMIGYLAEQPVPSRPRPRLYAGLADLPFVQEEYTALLRAAPADRSDVRGLVEGLIRAVASGHSRDSLVAALADLARRNALNAKDRRLLVALADEDPASLPDALVQALDEWMSFADPADAETLHALARIRLRRGQKVQALCTLRWVLANDMTDGRTAGHVEDRFERLDTYLAALPEEQRVVERRRWLSYYEPTPLDDLADDFDAACLRRWMDDADPADLDRRVERLRKRLERESPRKEFKSLSMTLTRCDALAGRLDSFQRMLRRLLSRPREELQASAPLDCTALLPPADRLGNPERYAEAVATELNAARDDGRMDDPACTRALCLLGHWCVGNHLRGAAQSILDRVATRTGEPGEHWLWVTDLSRELGAAPTAVDLETRLLLADLLPVVRVPALLAETESARGQEAADELAVRVAEYSDHPVVLERAARFAAARGDADAAERYRRRLLSVRPETARAP